MMSWRRPPTFMPSTPWSHPGITEPEPSWNSNGSPRSQEASNWRPLRNEMPTYCTVTWSPAFAGLPAPSSMSLMTSFLGALPFGTVIAGLVRSGVAAASGVDFDAGSSESEPQPATAIRAARAMASRNGRLASGMAPQGRRSTSAIGAEDAVARVPEARPDVAVGVQLAVERGGDDRDLVVRRAQRGDALRRRHQADERDAPRARALEPR